MFNLRAFRGGGELLGYMVGDETSSLGTAAPAFKLMNKTWLPRTKPCTPMIILRSETITIGTESGF